MKQSSLLNNPGELDERRHSAAESRLIFIFEEIPPQIPLDV